MVGREVATLRGERRDQVFPRQRTVATTSGGRNSQVLRGTAEYHEACNIMQVRGSAEALAREAARVELATAIELNVNHPPPIVATREGTPAAKGQEKGNGKDQ